MIIHTSENAISRLPHIQLDSSFELRDIAHMILAGGPLQRLYNLSTGEQQRAVEFLCNDAGAIRENEKGYPYFVMDQSSKRVNETLGILAVAGVHFPRVNMSINQDSAGTLQDLANAAMKSFRLNHAENSWSLMLFSSYPGVTAEWINDRGERHSVADILRNECSFPYGNGSCFGTHRLEGIAFAVRRFCLQEDVELSQLEGVWQEAYAYLEGAVHLMRRNQAEDGSLPRCWFRTKSIPRSSAEWIETLQDVAAARLHPQETLVHATGHCLDALSAVAELMPADREWIQRACYILGTTIETQWTSVGRRVAPLTHAIHALKLLDV